MAATNPYPVYTPTPVNRSVTPAVTAASAYTTGMVVGGKLSIPNAVRVSGGSGAVQHVSISKRTASEAPLDVFFFHTDPAASALTDRAVLNLAQADFARRVGVVRLTDLVDCGTPRIVQANNLFLPFTLATGTTLFAVPVLRGTETYATTDAVELSVGIIRY